MADIVESLVIDLLEWIGPESRPYADVIEAWRTSCPRVPVWEEANARGFVDRMHEAAGEPRVRVSPVGRPISRAAVRDGNVPGARVAPAKRHDRCPPAGDPGLLVRTINGSLRCMV